MVRFKQKQRWLKGLLCRWPSITECNMHITAEPPPHLRNDLYCVEWHVKLYCTYIHTCVIPRLLSPCAPCAGSRVVRMDLICFLA